MLMHDAQPVRFRRCLLPIVLLFLASAAMRWSWRDDRTVVSNIEASYHVLLTVEAMDQTPIAEHRFLPIVTLGRPLDRDVAFGASVRGPNGVYYYTSFPPLGFVAPWAFFRATHLTPTITHLMLFNLGIHLVATLLLALLVSEAVAALDVERSTHDLLVMLAAASYLFTFEALYSLGIIYWHHSLFQVIWLAQLVAFARVSRRVDGDTPIRRRDAALLLATGVLGPATEWTGYIATATLAGICWWRSRSVARDSLRRLSVGLLAGAAVAGFAFIAHFVWVIGFDPLVDALRARADARSTAHASFTALGRGYVESFGSLLVFGAAVVAAYLLAIGRRPLARWAIMLLVAAVLPLSENLLLAQHATTYHFDRLKTLIALVALFALLIALMPRAWQRPALFSWIFVLGWNFSHLTRTRNIGLFPPLATNDALMTRVKRVARPCAIYATDGFPRGWAELTLGGNIYEDVPNVDSLRALVASRHACQGLYFTVARDPGEAMFVWRRATIYDPASNRVDTLEWSPPRRLRASVRASASIGAGSSP
jgi:hypothetical protein